MTPVDDEKDKRIDGAAGAAPGASSLSKRNPPNPQTVGVEVGVKVEVQLSTDGSVGVADANPTDTAPEEDAW